MRKKTKKHSRRKFVPRKKLNREPRKQMRRRFLRRRKSSRNEAAGGSDERAAPPCVAVWLGHRSDSLGRGARRMLRDRHATLLVAAHAAGGELPQSNICGRNRVVARVDRKWRGFASARRPGPHGLDACGPTQSR